MIDPWLQAESLKKQVKDLQEEVDTLKDALNMCRMLDQQEYNKGYCEGRTQLRVNLAQILATELQVEPDLAISVYLRYVRQNVRLIEDLRRLTEKKDI